MEIRVGKRRFYVQAMVDFSVEASGHLAIYQGDGKTLYVPVAGKTFTIIGVPDRSFLDEPTGRPGDPGREWFSKPTEQDEIERKNQEADEFRRRRSESLNSMMGHPIKRPAEEA